jgi:hypothetical protein
MCSHRTPTLSSISGEYQHYLLEPNPPAIDRDGDSTGFAVPIDLEEMSDHKLVERWALAKQHQHTRQQLTKNDGDDAKHHRMNMCCAGH